MTYNLDSHCKVSRSFPEDFTCLPHIRNLNKLLKRTCSIRTLMSTCCCPREMENPPDSHCKRQRDTRDWSAAIAHLVEQEAKQRQHRFPAQGQAAKQRAGPASAARGDSRTLSGTNYKRHPARNRIPSACERRVMFLIFLKIDVQFKSVNTRISSLRKILSEFI